MKLHIYDMWTFVHVCTLIKLKKPTKTKAYSGYSWRVICEEQESDWEDRLGGHSPGKG